MKKDYKANSPDSFLQDLLNDANRQLREIVLLIATNKFSFQQKNESEKILPSHWFGDQSTLLQSIIDPFNAIFLHLQQKTRRHLRFWSSTVEECWGGMGEELPWHQVISFQGCFQITTVNATGGTHQEMLRSFHTLAMHTKKVRFLKGLETKVVVAKIPSTVLCELVKDATPRVLEGH